MAPHKTIRRRIPPLLGVSPFDDANLLTLSLLQSQKEYLFLSSRAEVSPSDVGLPFSVGRRCNTRSDKAIPSEAMRTGATLLPQTPFVDCVFLWWYKLVDFVIVLCYSLACAKWAHHLFYGLATWKNHLTSTWFVKLHMRNLQCIFGPEVLLAFILGTREVICVLNGFQRKKKSQLRYSPRAWWICTNHNVRVFWLSFVPTRERDNERQHSSTMVPMSGRYCTDDL